MYLIWSGSARRALLRIAFHYGQFDQGLPFEILAGIYDAPQILIDFPKIGSPTKRVGVRKWAVKNTPFILFYALRKDRIEVRHVVHSSSDWQNTL